MKRTLRKQVPRQSLRGRECTLTEVWNTIKRSKTETSNTFEPVHTEREPISVSESFAKEEQTLRNWFGNQEYVPKVIYEPRNLQQAIGVCKCFLTLNNSLISCYICSSIT
jgi:hypothetical protein